MQWHIPRPWFPGYCLPLELWALSTFPPAPRYSVNHQPVRFLISAPDLPGLPFLSPFLTFLSFSHLALAGSVSWAQDSETASLFLFRKPLLSFFLFSCYGSSYIYYMFCGDLPLWFPFLQMFGNFSREATDSVRKNISLLPPPGTEASLVLITLSCLLACHIWTEFLLAFILF